MHRLLALVAVAFFALTVGLAIAETEPSRGGAPRAFTFEDFGALKALPELKLKQLDAAKGDVRTQVAALRAEVRELQKTVARLEARIAELDSPHPKLVPLAGR